MLGGQIENLDVHGVIKGNGYVGGIAASGQNNSTDTLIKNCRFNGYLENSSTEEIYQGTGGIVGNGNANRNIKIEGCSVSGEIKGLKQLGGIVGYGGLCVINKCKNESNLVGDNTVGGIVGKGTGDTTIKNSFNTGTCISNKQTAGGIVGYNCGEISNCYNKGTVIGINSGGIISNYYFVTTTLNNSYNAGIVKKSEDVEGAALIHMVFPVSTALTINNVFWQENTTKKWITSGADKVTGESIMMTKEEMTTKKSLLEKLNTYVDTYNEENKNNENFVQLLNWIEGEDGYPTLF